MLLNGQEETMPEINGFAENELEEIEEIHLRRYLSENSVPSTNLSFTSTIYGFGMDTGRLVKRLGDGVISLIDETAIRLRLRSIRKELDNLNELSENPEQLKSVLDDLIRIIEVSDRYTAIAKTCILQITRVLEYQSTSASECILILIKFYLNLRRFAPEPYMNRWDTQHVQVWFEHLQRRFRGTKIQNVIDCHCQFIRILPDLLCEEDKLNITVRMFSENVEITRQVITKHGNAFFDKFIHMVAHWIRQRYRNHRLCYLLAALTYFQHDAPTSRDTSLSSCILREEGQFVCGSTLDKSIQPSDIKKLIALHDLRSVLHGFGSLSAVDLFPGIQSNFSQLSQRHGRTSLEQQLINNLLATFPTANINRRWAFKVPILVRDAIIAMSILERFGVLSLDTVVQCTLIKGCSVYDYDSDSVQESAFDPAIYCWGLSFFRFLSLERPLLNDLWLNPEVYSRFLIWLNVDEEEFSSVKNMMTWNLLDPDGRWVWENESHWMEQCYELPFLEEKLKKILRKRLLNLKHKSAVSLLL